MTWTLAGRYRLTSSVASGPTGELWRAVDNGTGHPVAVKLLHPYLAADDRVVDQLLRARRSLAELWHPGIARLIDVVLNGDRPSRPAVGLVADFVPGTDLGQLLAAAGPLPPARAASVAAAMADALQAAHRAGVVHGDLKPSNVMVASHGGEAIRLTDFSVATLVRVGQNEIELPEISPYTAPWEIDGGMPTFASDVHALGVVLHEMLTGSPTPADAQLPVDSRLRELVAACLDVNHAAPLASEVAGELRELAPYLPRTAPRRPPAPARGGGSTGRHAQAEERLTAAPPARGTRPSRDRSGHDRTARDQAGRDRSGRDRSGRDRSGRDRPGRDRPGRDRPGSDQPGRRKAPIALGVLAAVAAAAVVAAVAVGLLNRSEPDSSAVDRSATIAATDGVPELPADATAATQEGGTVFVAHWFAVLTHATRTGDTTALAAATSPECQQCQAAIAAIEAAHGEGGSIRGGGYVVRNTTLASFWSEERPVYDATLDRSARTSVTAGGDTLATLAALSFTTCSLVLEWSEERWQVREVITPGCVG